MLYHQPVTPLRFKNLEIGNPRQWQSLASPFTATTFRRMCRVTADERALLLSARAREYSIHRGRHTKDAIGLRGLALPSEAILSQRGVHSLLLVAATLTMATEGEGGACGFGTGMISRPRVKELKEMISDFQASHLDTIVKELNASNGGIMGQNLKEVRADPQLHAH